MSPTFSEGVPQWSANISNRTRAIWIVCTIQYTGGSPIFLPVIFPFDCLSGSTSFWGIFLVPQLPMMIEDPKLLEGLLCSVSRNPLPSFFLSLWRRS